MRLVLQFLDRMLGKRRIEIITIILVVMLLAEVAIRVSIFEIELDPSIYLGGTAQARAQKAFDLCTDFTKGGAAALHLN